MNNDSVVEKNWWSKNWKLFAFISAAIFACLIFIITLLNGFTDFGQTLSDPSICQNAIDLSNKNRAVILNLGKLEPIDKLAIIEGNSVYSNNDQSVQITVRVTGERAKGKLDISAEKIDGMWKYRNIKIRVKSTGKEIQVKS